MRIRQGICKSISGLAKVIVKEWNDVNHITVVTESGVTCNAKIREGVLFVDDLYDVISSHRFDFFRALEPADIICIDCETTGLNPDEDELLQVSICNGAGVKLFNSYVRPVNHKSWDEAAAINGITPEMVANAPDFSKIRPCIQSIVDEAALIVGYNFQFDQQFLANAGIAFDSRLFDAMLEYAEFRQEYKENGKVKFFKLVDAAADCGYTFNAHDALEDAKATVVVFNRLLERVV